MRGLMTLVGLLITLGVVGVLVRKQMTTVSAPVLQLPSEAASSVSVPASGQMVQQGQQVQQAYKQAIEGAMQARPMPDDK